MKQFPGVVPGGSRAVPGGSRAVPAQFPESGSPVPRSTTYREPGTTPARFPEWLSDLKTRNLTLSIHHTGTPRIDGPLDRVTRDDTRTLYRHAHALQIAAAGTHPTWWNHVARAGPLPTRLDDIPTTPDHRSADGVAFACTTCGQPADTIDAHLLAWCHTHE